MIHYRDVGEGKPVIFIHGNWASSKWWKYVKPVSGYRFIMPDLPGFGESKVSGYFYPSIDFYSKCLVEFIEEVVDEKVTLVGHSLGGAVALNTACLSEVDRILLIGSPPPEGIRTPLYYYYYAPFMGDQLKSQMLSEVTLYSDEDFLLEEANKMNDGGILGNNIALERWNAPPVPESVRSTVVHCEYDNLININDSVRLSNYLDSDMMVVESGHSPMLERPDEFQRVLEEFLNGRVSGDRGSDPLEECAG